jgi:iron-sulfur cluster repair protein YtfE (RIC family)
MAKAVTKPRAGGAEKRILAEHRTIREVLQQIENSKGLVELLELLKNLRAVLERHFMSEEAPQGFFDSIREMSSRQLAMLDRLEKEHGALLAEVDGVSERARACLTGAVAAILTEARALVRRLRVHETAEETMLIDTMYTDLGQGD